MIIKENEALEKKVGPMLIKDYKINPNFSGTLITIDGTHGLMKNIKEDRIYFVIEGKGKFIVNGEEKIGNERLSASRYVNYMCVCKEVNLCIVVCKTI